MLRHAIALLVPLFVEVTRAERDADQNERAHGGERHRIERGWREIDNPVLIGAGRLVDIAAVPRRTESHRKFFKAIGQARIGEGNAVAAA